MEKKTESQPEAFGTYGDDVFSEKVIARLLPKKVAEKLLATMRDSKPLDPKIADDVAEAMKRWAVQYANVARVTAPKHLVEEIREELKKAAALYDLDP